MTSRLILGVSLAVSMFANAVFAQNKIDEMSLDRWKQLREAERHQMNVAEKYYRERQYKIALGEYEKFVTLYEKSEGSSFAQFKWAICQIHLKKLNTAISDGFQTVIDYWPDSPDAPNAAYYIGRCQKEMGELKKANKSYLQVVSKYESSLAAVYALSDMIDLADAEMNIEAKVTTWKKLVYDIKRTPGDANNLCVQASIQLATHYFSVGQPVDGVASIATTYKDNQFPYHLWYYCRTPIGQLAADPKTKDKADKSADGCVAAIRERTPTDLTKEEDKKNAREWAYYIADIQAYSRRDDKVVEAYQASIKQYGVNDLTLQRFGDWYKSVQKYDEARKLYAQFANRPEGLSQIAWSFVQQQKYDDAVVHYRQAAGLDSQNQPKWNEAIAVAYRHGSRWKEAIDAFTENLKIDAANTEKWLWWIAITQRDGGMYKEAIGTFRQCTNFPENTKQMAWCHRALKEWNESIILYNQVTASAPDAPWAMYQIAQVREASGDNEAAIKAYQVVCKKFPKDGHAAQAHAHLQTKYKINVTLGGAAED
ncbi:MAG: tetratricopeptide repeat protein [Planctomycetes bacterium]|nr:tetratricopeptide repeat protein [Planctomycetota bacterium]